MLDFMRKYAVTIALSIVVFFAGTMFTGLLFFDGLSGNSSSQKTANEYKSAIAILGEIPIPQTAYYSQLQQQYLGFQRSGINLLKADPALIEYAKYNSLKQATDYVLLKQGADEAGIKASRSEVAISIDRLLESNGLKNKSELKSLLKERNVTWKYMTAGIKDDIIIQKFIKSLEEGIQVTDLDINNQYIKLKVRHILIPKQEGVEAITLAQTAKTELESGAAFSEVAKKYSSDIASAQNGGELGWITGGLMIPEFEVAAYSLDLNEFSDPVKSIYGYHVIQVTDREYLPLPENFNKEDERKSLEARQKQGRLTQFLEAQKLGKELTLNDKSLEAIEAKVEGDTEKAKGAYQSLISASPSNPVPHYLLAKLLLESSDTKTAKRHLQKADVLADLSPDAAIPYINIELGTLYRKEKSWVKMNEQFQKAIERAGDDYILNLYLEQSFKDMKDSRFLPKVQSKLQKIKAALETAKEESSSTSS